MGEYQVMGEKRRFVPHVIEPSLGVDRLFLALLCSAFDEDEVSGEKREVLRLHPSIAPITVGIFPLLKKQEGQVERQRVWHPCLGNAATTSSMMPQVPLAAATGVWMRLAPPSVAPLILIPWRMILLRSARGMTLLPLSVCAEMSCQLFLARHVRCPCDVPGAEVASGG